MKFFAMAILPILTYDDEHLREETPPVKENSENLQELIDDLFETMYNANGVGLAAPQVGEIKRLFVADVDPLLEDQEKALEQKHGPMVFINPEWEAIDEEKDQQEEGCLSIPEVREKVKRPFNIKVQYLDRDFNKQTLEATGWLSRVIQHESDHLDGVLFIDYLSSFRKRLIKGKLNKIDRGEVKTDYPVEHSTISAR